MGGADQCAILSSSQNVTVAVSIKAVVTAHLSPSPEIPATSFGQFRWSWAVLEQIGGGRLAVQLP